MNAKTSSIAESQSERIARVIFQHATRIGSEQEISELVRLNADLARDLIGAERCTLWLLDERNHQLWTKVAHGTEEIRIPARSARRRTCPFRIEAGCGRGRICSLGRQIRTRSHSRSGIPVPESRPRATNQYRFSKRAQPQTGSERVEERDELRLLLHRERAVVIGDENCFPAMAKDGFLSGG